MATQVLTIVGGVIGGFIGGPVGASIGMSIGGYVGKTLEPTQVLEGPRLDDLTVTYSTYGAAIPLHYGRSLRTAGNVIVSSGLVESEHSEGQDSKGGGGGTETRTYTYSVSFAVALGVGVMHNILRIWANGKLLWSMGGLEISEDEAQAAYDAAVTAEAAAAEGYINAPSAATWNSWQEAIETVSATEAALAAATAARDIESSNDSPWSISAGAGLTEGNLGYLAFYPGTETQTPDPVLEAVLGAGEVPGYRGMAYIVLGGLQLADYGNSMPSIEVEVEGRTASDVVTIARDICRTAGLADMEVSTLTVPAVEMRGYSVSRAGSALAILQDLSGPYNFGFFEQGGRIQFYSRDRTAQLSVDVGEFAARESSSGGSPESPLTIKTASETTLPKEVNVTYKDPGRDFQESTERAVVYGTRATNIDARQAPFVLAPEAARAYADRVLYESWVSRRSLDLRASTRLDPLFPGDKLILPFRGVHSAWRMESVARGDNGVVEIHAVMDDLNVCEGTAPGATTSVPAQALPLVGTTIVYVANTPIIGSADTDTSLTWGITAASADWRGGQMFKSADLGVSWASVASAGPRSTLGTVAVATPAGAVDLWDTENTIRVVLAYDSQTLASCTEDEVLNGKNGAWIGAADGSHGEVIQYTTATLVTASPKTYDLSGLLRGRRGTEHEVGLHGANEVFMKVTIDSLRTLDFGWPDVDLSRWYKGVSLYQSTTSVSSHLTFTNTAERAKPRSPVQGQGARDSSNNLTITWVRRIRGYAPVMGYGDVPLDEPVEAYEVDIYKSGSIVRTLSATSATVGYTAAQQTSDGITPGAAVTVKIYQISATRGRGHAGEFTL